jgi:hypothetical protein
MARSCSLLVFAAAMCVSEGARAQASDGERAQELFDRGVALMETNRFDEACPILQESHRLEAAGGTALNLAYCFERATKLIAAERAYREAERIADADGRADRRAQAQARRAKLVARIPTILLTVPSSAVDVLEIRVDEHVLTANERTIDPSTSVATIRVDPGAHVLEVQSTSGARATRRLVAEDGQSISVVIEERELSGHAPARAADSTANAPAPPYSGRKTTALAVGIGGAAVVAVGSVFGILALTEHAESERLCPNGECAPGGIDAERTADAFGWTANACLGAGIVALGVATALWLTAPKTQRGSSLRFGMTF